MGRRSRLILIVVLCALVVLGTASVIIYVEMMNSLAASLEEAFKEGGLAFLAAILSETTLEIDTSGINDIRGIARVDDSTCIIVDGSSTIYRVGEDPTAVSTNIPGSQFTSIVRHNDGWMLLDESASHIVMVDDTLQPLQEIPLPKPSGGRWVALLNGMEGEVGLLSEDGVLIWLSPLDLVPIYSEHIPVTNLRSAALFGATLLTVDVQGELTCLVNEAPGEWKPKEFPPYSHGEHGVAATAGDACIVFSISGEATVVLGGLRNEHPR